jgi:hypothetical protein
MGRGEIDSARRAFAQAYLRIPLKPVCCKRRLLGTLIQNKGNQAEIVKLPSLKTEDPPASFSEEHNLPRCDHGTRVVSIIAEDVVAPALNRRVSGQRIEPLPLDPDSPSLPEKHAPKRQNLLRSSRLFRHGGLRCPSVPTPKS